MSRDSALQMTFVIAGLDPAIYFLRKKYGEDCPLARTTDTRVKPAYDCRMCGAALRLMPAPRILTHCSLSP